MCLILHSSTWNDMYIIKHSKVVSPNGYSFVYIQFSSSTMGSRWKTEHIPEISQVKV